MVIELITRHVYRAMGGVDLNHAVQRGRRRKSSEGGMASPFKNQWNENDDGYLFNYNERNIRPGGEESIPIGRQPMMMMIFATSAHGHCLTIVDFLLVSFMFNN